MRVRYVFTLLTGFLFGSLSLADTTSSTVGSTTTTTVTAECPDNCVPKKPTPKPKAKKKTIPPAKPTAKDTVDVRATVIVKTEEKSTPAPVPVPVAEKPVCKDVKHHTLDFLLGKGPAGLGLDVYKTKDRYNEYSFQEGYGWEVGLHYSYEFSGPSLFINRVGIGALSSNPTTVFGSIGRSW